MQDETPLPDPEPSLRGAPTDPVFREWGTFAFSAAVILVIALGLWTAIAGDRVGELRHPEQVAVRGLLRPVEVWRGMELATAAATPTAEDAAAEEDQAEAAQDSPAADEEAAADEEDAQPNTSEQLVRGAIEGLLGAAADLEQAAEAGSTAAAEREGEPEAAPSTRLTPAQQRAAALGLRVRAATLLADLGDLDWEAAAAGSITEHALLDALRSAYGAGPAPTEDALEAARALGEDPAALLLREALKLAAGDEDGAFDLRQLADRRARERFELLLQLVGRLAPALFVGLGLLAASFFLPRDAARVGSLSSPADTFSTGDAWGVFVRYFVLFQLIGTMLSLSLGMRLGGYEILLASLPVVGLVQLVAVRRERQLGDLLGIDVDTTRPLRFIPVTLAGWVMCVALLLGITPILTGLPGSNPWANPLLDALLAHDHDRAGLLRGAVLWAPIFEEIAFRGVLYAGLRARFGVLRAALLSSLVFGFAHSYDLGGNLAIASVGFIFALLYERSKSLLPCIFAHALFNYGQIAYMLRLFG